MRPRTVKLTGSAQAITSGQGYVTFISLAETSGSAAVTAQLFDGTTTSNQLLYYYTMAESTSTSQSLRKMALPYQLGLYISPSGSGTLTGALTFHHCDSPGEWYALIEALSQGTL